MSDIVISGYYGLGNSGDEALLKSIVEDLREINPDVKITALSGNAKQTKLLYGIKTVNRFNIFSVFNEMRQAKLLLSGGGTLIQDATSTKSLMYYLGIISLAKKLGLKVMLYANGMGPIKNKNIKKVKSVLNKVDLITLRENVSLGEIERCEITKPRVIVTADPAFNLRAANDARTEELLREFNVPFGAKLLTVSIRNWQGLSGNFAADMATSLDALSKKGYFPVFVPMQMSMDLELSQKIKGMMKSESAIVDRELPVDELLAIIGKSTVSCGMRLHLLIFASVMNIPMAGIVYDPKIKGFMEYMNQKDYIELEDFESERFTEMVASCGENSGLKTRELEEKSEDLRKKARENAYLAMKLIEN